MESFVAISKIVSYTKGTVYAEKHDVLELICEHGEVLICRNKRTNETFPTTKEKTGVLDESNISLFVETAKKKQINHTSRQKFYNEKQTTMF